MKVVHVGLRAPGASSIEVVQSATRASDVLTLGEHVLVETSAGELYAAEVVAITPTWWDRVYELELGARLPRDLALERLAGLDPAVHDVATHEVLDLLGELAREHRRHRRLGSRPLRSAGRPHR